MHRVNNQGQTTNTYNGGHTGKGKKGASKKRVMKSVYAACSYNALKQTPKNGYGVSSTKRRRVSNVFNPLSYNYI